MHALGCGQTCIVSSHILLYTADVQCDPIYTIHGQDYS